MPLVIIGDDAERWVRGLAELTEENAYGEILAFLRDNPGEAANGLLAKAMLDFSQNASRDWGVIVKIIAIYETAQKQIDFMQLFESYIKAGDESFIADFKKLKEMISQKIEKLSIPDKSSTVFPEINSDNFVALAKLYLLQKALLALEGSDITPETLNTWREATNTYKAEILKYKKHKLSLAPVLNASDASDDLDESAESAAAHMFLASEEQVGQQEQEQVHSSLLTLLKELNEGVMYRTKKKDEKERLEKLKETLKKDLPAARKRIKQIKHSITEFIVVDPSAVNPIKFQSPFNLVPGNDEPYADVLNRYSFSLTEDVEEAALRMVIQSTKGLSDDAKEFRKNQVKKSFQKARQAYWDASYTRMIDEVKFEAMLENYKEPGTNANLPITSGSLPLVPLSKEVMVNMFKGMTLAEARKKDPDAAKLIEAAAKGKDLSARYTILMGTNPHYKRLAADKSIPAAYEFKYKPKGRILNFLGISAPSIFIRSSEPVSYFQLNKNPFKSKIYGFFLQLLRLQNPFEALYKNITLEILALYQGKSLSNAVANTGNTSLYMIEWLFGKAVSSYIQQPNLLLVTIIKHMYNYLYPLHSYPKLLVNASFGLTNDENRLKSRWWIMPLLLFSPLIILSKSIIRVLPIKKGKIIKWRNFLLEKCKIKKDGMPLAQETNTTPSEPQIIVRSASLPVASLSAAPRVSKALSDAEILIKILRVPNLTDAANTIEPTEAIQEIIKENKLPKLLAIDECNLPTLPSLAKNRAHSLSSIGSNSALPSASRAKSFSEGVTTAADPKVAALATITLAINKARVSGEQVTDDQITAIRNAIDAQVGDGKPFKTIGDLIIAAQPPTIGRG